MDGANASGAVKIKTGTLEKRAIQPRVLPMGHCAVVGEALALADALNAIDLEAEVIPA
jgi:hypothetical protein